MKSYLFVDLALVKLNKNFDFENMMPLKKVFLNRGVECIDVMTLLGCFIAYFCVSDEFILFIYLVSKTVSKMQHNLYNVL